MTIGIGGTDIALTVKANNDGITNKRVEIITSNVLYETAIRHCEIVHRLRIGSLVSPWYFMADAIKLITGSGTYIYQTTGDKPLVPKLNQLYLLIEFGN
jgi:hypothetical protein